MADTVAIGSIVSVITSTAGTQGSGPSGSLVVIVRSTVIPAISAAEGVYVAPGNEALSKVPVPAVVQVIVEADPPKPPDNVYVEPEHITSSDPAVAVGVKLNVNSIASVTKGQGPAGSSVVIVSVTSPAAISAADGV